MGWMYRTTPCSKRDYLKDLVRDFTNDNEKCKIDVLAKTVRGNCFWMVCEVTRKDTGIVSRFIVLALLGCDKGCWGYKDIEESMHPYFYSCPVKYLDMVPEVGCQVWRDKVREIAARKARKMQVGDVYELPGCKPRFIRIVNARPLTGRDVNGNLYRIRRGHVGDKMGMSLDDAVEAYRLREAMATIPTSAPVEGPVNVPCNKAVDPSTIVPSQS
jgi:hypothetical protein